MKNFVSFIFVLGWVAACGGKPVYTLAEFSQDTQALSVAQTHLTDAGYTTDRDGGLVDLKKGTAASDKKKSLLAARKIYLDYVNKYENDFDLKMSEGTVSFSKSSNTAMDVWKSRMANYRKLAQAIETEAAKL